MGVLCVFVERGIVGRLGGIRFVGVVCCGYVGERGFRLGEGWWVKRGY